MRMLLINQNPVVSKLSGLSAQKSGFEVVETPFPQEIEEGPYDILFVDDARLDEVDVQDIKRRIGVHRTCLIYSDDEKKAEGFDYYLKKPFLPTEMVDLLSEIKDDMLLPEIEEADEQLSDEEYEQNEPEEMEKSLEKPVEKEEILQSLSPEEPGAEAEEQESHEEFSKEPHMLEEREHMGVETQAEQDFSVESVETQEGTSDEETKEEEREKIDFEALMEEMENVDTQEELASEAKEIEALLEETEHQEMEDLQEEEESLSELHEISELSETEGGILDEEQVNAVKELLEETVEPEGVEESELAIEERIEETLLPEAESVLAEESPLESTLEDEVSDVQQERSTETSEVADELDLISEEELAAALENTATSAAGSKGGKGLEEEADNTHLLAKLAGIDPEALRKVLAGAQITINITFPKEA